MGGSGVDWETELVTGEQPDLTLNQPGAGKSVSYQGLFSFDLAFMRCKCTSPGIWQMNNRALRFWKTTQNGAAILLYLERARPDCEPASPCTLRGPGQEIYRNVAWRHTALQITVQRDFSRTRVVFKDSKTGRKWEGRKSRAATDFLTKN